MAMVLRRLFSSIAKVDNNLGICSRLWPLSRERSLSCHTYCDTGDGFVLSRSFEGQPHSVACLFVYSSKRGINLQ
jgi:hypothetical protein